MFSERYNILSQSVDHWSRVAGKKPWFENSYDCWMEMTSVVSRIRHSRRRRTHRTAHTLCSPVTINYIPSRGPFHWPCHEYYTVIAELRTYTSIVVYYNRGVVSYPTGWIVFQKKMFTHVCWIEVVAVGDGAVYTFSRRYPNYENYKLSVHLVPFDYNILLYYDIMRR